MKGLKRTALLWIAVALGYAITGRIGLALAIPPGYATAIFPPTGVALCAVLLARGRALPGVWAGSFLMNLWVSFDRQGHLTATHLQLSALIGAGAALQAALGAQLIGHRRRSAPAGAIRLDSWQEITSFMLLGGPVACLVAASIGVTSLYLYGAISAHETIYSFWNWWIGDAIGVLIVTPVLLSFLGTPAEVWRPRRLTVTVPLLVTCALTVVLFLLSSRWENERIERAFHQQAERVTSRLVDTLGGYLNALHQTERALAVTAPPTRRDFSRFASYTVETSPRIEALEWVAEVPAAEREAFVASQRVEEPGFTITELDPSGALVPAGDRAVVYPVTYAAPPARNAKVMGLDLGSEPLRRETLQRAQRQDGIAVSPSVRLVQGGFAVFAVLQVGAPRRGFAVAVIQLSGCLDDLMTADVAPGLGLSLADLGARGALEIVRSKTATPEGWSSRLYHEHAFGFGDRTFRLRVLTTPAYLAEQRSLQAWFVLAGGLTFSALLGAFLLLISGRAARVELLVAERTAQLLTERERSERLKSDFVSTVSHELRTPLTSIRGALGLLRGGVAGPLAEEIDELVGIADQNAVRLLSLVGDLLDIEKLSHGKLPISMTEAHVMPLLEKSVEENRGYAAERGVQLSLTAAGLDDAVVAVDEGRFAQVLNNLLSNAMKFSPAGGTVLLSACAMKGGVRVNVTDQGPGIPAAFRDRLFTKFAQADSGDARKYAGTGLGLYLCKLLVEQMGGTIGVESEVGEGATFFVELRGCAVIER